MSIQYRLGTRSWDRLQGVHPALVAVVARATMLSPMDFTVLEGLRTKERQRVLVARGASQTLRSRHLTGHAVDLGALRDGVVMWEMPLYVQLDACMLVAAREIGVPVEWGGNWTTLRDGPHWQLPWREYPA